MASILAFVLFANFCSCLLRCTRREQEIHARQAYRDSAGTWVPNPSHTSVLRDDSRSPWEKGGLDEQHFGRISPRPGNFGLPSETSMFERSRQFGASSMPRSDSYSSTGSWDEGSSSFSAQPWPRSDSYTWPGRSDDQDQPSAGYPPSQVDFGQPRSKSFGAQSWPRDDSYSSTGRWDGSAGYPPSQGDFGRPRSRSFGEPSWPRSDSYYSSTGRWDEGYSPSAGYPPSQVDFGRPRSRSFGAPSSPRSDSYHSSTGRWGEGRQPSIGYPPSQHTFGQPFENSSFEGSRSSSAPSWPRSDSYTWPGRSDDQHQPSTGYPPSHFKFGQPASERSNPFSTGKRPHGNSLGTTTGGWDEGRQSSIGSRFGQSTEQSGERQQFGVNSSDLEQSARDSGASGTADAVKFTFGPTVPHNVPNNKTWDFGKHLMAQSEHGKFISRKSQDQKSTCEGDEYKSIWLVTSQVILPNRYKIASKRFYHGTRVENIRNIVNNGFRRPAAIDSDDGLMVGSGFYLTDVVNKADQYSIPTKEDPKLFPILQIKVREEVFNNRVGVFLWRAQEPQERHDRDRDAEARKKTELDAEERKKTLDNYSAIINGSENSVIIGKDNLLRKLRTEYADRMIHLLSYLEHKERYKELTKEHFHESNGRRPLIFYFDEYVVPNSLLQDSDAIWPSMLYHYNRCPAKDPKVCGNDIEWEGEGLNKNFKYGECRRAQKDPETCREALSCYETQATLNRSTSAGDAASFAPKSSQPSLPRSKSEGSARSFAP